MEKAKGTFKIQLMLAVIAAAACIVLSGAFAQSAYADDGSPSFPVNGFKGTATGYLSDSNSLVFIEGSKKFSAIKSSNKKVATVKKDGSKTLVITMKKAGTTKISFKYNGKKRTVDFKVKKYTNPLKAFKIGSKSFAGKYKKDNLFMATKYATGKLNVKTKSGWKVAGIAKITSTDDDENEGWITIKNGAKIKTSDFIIGIKLYNKATNGYIVEMYSQYEF